jgi:imidazolonepropionase-like amidohydrolase
MPRTLFKDVNVFDGTGNQAFPGSVLVDDERIAAVARGDEPIESNGATVVSGDGAFLIPGLVEAHAHLTWPSSIGRIFQGLQLPPEEHLLVAAYNAHVLLDHGFTSAYSAGSRGERFEVALRDEIDAGYLPGPRLRASSQETSGVAVPGVPGTHDNPHDRSIEGLRAYVARMAKQGVDSIKFELSGDESSVCGGSELVLFTEPEIAAIGAQARESQVWLACHAQAALAIKLAVKHGFRVLYHCTLADEEALDLLQENKDDLFVAPAVGLLYARVHEAEQFGIDRATAQRMGAVAGLDRMQQIYPEMRRRGIRVLPGGDYGFPYTPIGRNARDLQLFVDLFGYSPAQALAAATLSGGELMGLPVGQIRDGFLADLLLVDGNPLQNLRILQDPMRLCAIMKGGRFHKPPSNLRL